MDCNFIVNAADTAGYGITALSLNGAGISNVFMNSSATVTGTTHTSTSVTAVSSTANLLVGMPVSGTGIPAGTTIATITSSTAMTLSAATTTSASITIHYSAVGSPASSAGGGVSAGTIVVQFQDNFNYYIGGGSNFQSPVSGTPISISGSSVLTIGAPYVIQTVGTSTTANWVAAGLPVGQIPTVGQAFIAKIVGSGTGTGTVEAPSNSGIDHIEVIGDPNTTFGAYYNGASILGGASGSYMLFQCLAASVATAPALGTKINLRFYMSNSYIAVQGY